MSFSDDDEYDVLSMKDITSFSPRKTTDVDDEIENRKNKNYHKQHGHHLTKEEQLIMSNFDSLDYNVVESKLYQNRRIRPIVEGSLKWFLSFLTGICTGALACAISLLVKLLSDSRFKITQHLLTISTPLVAFCVYSGLAVAFVFVSSMLVVFVEPIAGGSGIPEIKAYLNGTNFPRLLRIKTLIVKAIGVSLAVSGGLAVGKEGPLVHSGAIIAANLSHLPKFPHFFGRFFKIFRNDQMKRDFVSCGAAAGVSSAFGAPIGGILFSFEEASSFWSLQLTWRVFFTAMVSTFTLNALLSGARGNWLAVNSPGLITFGSFVTRPYSLWELPFFALLGLFGGLLGAAFCAVNVRVSRWRRDFFRNRKVLRVIEAVLVTFLTAILSFWIPAFFSCRDVPAGEDVESYRRYTCPEGQYNDMATTIFATSEISIKAFFHNEAGYSFSVLGLYGALMFCLANITYGIAVPSGLFVPGILVGCSFGRALGQFLQLYLSSDIRPGTYALIGAASMLGGVTRITICLTVILIEVSNDIQYLLPIMLVVMISKIVADRFNIALYDAHLELKCVPFVESAPPPQLARLQARDIMSAPVECVNEIASVKRVLSLLASTHHNGFPVVRETSLRNNDENDDQNRRVCVGLILRSQLIRALQCDELMFSLEQAEQIKHQEPIIPKSLHLEDFSTTLSSRTHHHKIQHLYAKLKDDESCACIDLRVIFNPAPFSVQQDCPVPRVYRLARAMGLRHLVVVDAFNSCVGMITRKDIRTDYKQDLS